MKNNQNKSHRLITPLIFLLVLHATDSYSQWSTDPSVNTPIVVKEGIQGSSIIVSDNMGGAIVSWYSYDNTAINVYVQRINRSGEIQWTDGGIMISGGQVNTHIPHMTADGEGGAIVSWFEPRIYNKNEDFAQRIKADGTLLWTPGGVSVGLAENHFQHGSPAITSDSSGGAIIAWADWRGDFSDINLCARAQRIDSDGSLMWEPAGIALCKITENSIGDPEITSDDNGGAIIVWDHWDGSLSTGNRNIYAQRITSGGTLAWAADSFTICSQLNDQRRPRICSDGNGGAIIIWQDYRNGSAPQLFAQKINAAGEIQWTADGVPVVIYSTISQDYYSIISDGAGGAYICIQFGNSAVSIQHLNASGEMLWGDTGTSPNDLTESRYPGIIADGKGGLFVAWTGQNYDVYAQHMNSSAESLWTPRGVLISSANGNQLSPKLTCDDSGGAILVWDDCRSVDNVPDVYVQRVSVNGLLEQPEEEEGPDAISWEKEVADMLGQSYPNPCRENFTIDYHINCSGNVSLQVYDISGREVAVPVSAFLVPGDYSVSCTTENMPAGMYYYRLSSAGMIETRSLAVGK